MCPADSMHRKEADRKDTWEYDNFSYMGEKLTDNQPDEVQDVVMHVNECQAITLQHGGVISTHIMSESGSFVNRSAVFCRRALGTALQLLCYICYLC